MLKIKLFCAGGMSTSILVKKMLEAVNNKVIYLKRLTFGKLELRNMELGEVIEIELEDII